MTRLRRFFLFGLLLHAAAVPAALVEQTSAAGLMLTALYQQGEADKPALLILHGFLQTRDFPVVQWLGEALADEGYAVLLPTLSLRINRRIESLPCDAIHTHSMGADVHELGLWVHWLKQQGYQRVVLIGHSSGSLNVLAYTLDHPQDPVQSLVVVSLLGIDNSIDKTAYRKQLEQATTLAKSGRSQLDEYALGFCKKYLAPPNAFLSYARWVNTEVLTNIPRLQTPLYVILGGADRRVARDWPARLRKKGATVFVVPGANHFFDAEHSFDLLDTIEKILESLD